MSLVLRLLLYLVCLFLVMIVYTGQKNATAVATLRASTKMTAKLMVWSIVGIGVMWGIELAFVD